MDYKSLMGYGKKNKKVTKKSPEPKSNKILENVKKEFGYPLNEWSEKPSNTPKRWTKTFNGKQGLTEFEQQGGKDTLKEVGNSQVHKKFLRKIEDGEGYFKSAVDNYVDFLIKQGHKKEANEIKGKYMFVGKFTHWMKTKWVRMLRKLI